MTRKEWKLNWQRARLNKRNCESQGYEFYPSTIASDVLHIRDFFDEFGFTKKEFDAIYKGKT
jgi:hypothetical protein